MLASPSEGETRFFGDFWHLQYPKSHILAPSSEESATRRKIPDATPDYIFLSLLENVQATNTSKRRGPCTGGQKLLFTATGGQAKELGGQVPPSLYVKRGPVVLLSVGTLGYSLVDTSH